MSVPVVPVARAASLVADLVQVIVDNKAYLSEIDGAIGDGDHGINMAKGFASAGKKLTPLPTLHVALRTLGETLMEDVGGSMGPLYGQFFISMADTVGDAVEVDATRFGAMLGAAQAAIQDLGSAKVGDKTLLDTLIPARAAYDEAVAAGQPFTTCLERMVAAAERGRDSTREMVAKVGRASRLGERSRGVLDAGATSCCLILSTMARSLRVALAG